MGKRGVGLVKPSTRAFVREALKLRSQSAHQPEARKYSLLDFLHGYFYGRWIYLYIGIGLGEHPLAKKYGGLIKKLGNGWAGLKRRLPGSKVGSVHKKLPGVSETYHGKVVPLEAARQLVMVNEPVDLPNLEHIIPYPRARDIILRNPDHIAVLDCPCRSARQNPCLPLDVCLVIGEPFASFVVEHNPQKARRITPQEAVDILKAEDARGHVHHAFFKDAMLNRFYAICNCCSCCCGAMQAQRNGSPMLASSGYVARVDEAQCLGCGDCESVCQFEAIAVPMGTAQVDEAACMGCGVCVEHCPNGALSLLRDLSRGEPLEICQLMAAQSFNL